MDSVFPHIEKKRCFEMPAEKDLNIAACVL